jgi:hypothetical protein
MKFCAVLLGFIACLGACSSKDTTDPYATVSEFCAAWGKEACTSLVVSHCSGMDTTSALTEACVEKQQTFCEGLVAPNAAGFSSAQAKTCLSAVSAAYADASLSASEIATVRHLEAPCNHLIKGPQAEGDSCTQDTDCDTVKNVQCVMKSGVGTCVIPTAVANGFSCAAPAASCMTGFYCDGSHCVSSDAIGEKCDADFECATGLTCKGVDADAGVTSGKCAARVSQTACTGDSDCTTNVCDIATGASTGMCVNSIILSPAESVCGDLR